MVNTLISIALLFAAMFINVFAQPVFSLVFGKSTSGDRMLWTGMFILAFLDLAIRIVDLRKTRTDLNARLIAPKSGGSFLLAPCWILAFFVGFYVIFSS